MRGPSARFDQDAGRPDLGVLRVHEPGEGRDRWAGGAAAGSDSGMPGLAGRVEAPGGRPAFRTSAAMTSAAVECGAR